MSSREPPSERVSLRPLEGETDDMLALQRVLDDAPRHAHLVTGLPPGPADAQSVYTILPEGRSYDDKFVFGIFEGATMVGCIDCIRGYPETGTAHIGLLLVAESFEGRGIGRAAYAELEGLIAGWGCSRVRLGVVRTDDRVFAFWKRLGFVPTGEIKPHRYAAVVSELVVFHKRLGA